MDTRRLELEGKRRQKLYQWYRRQWRYAHPIATADPGKVKYEHVKLPEVITVDILKDVVAFYKNHPIHGWK